MQYLQKYFFQFISILFFLKFLHFLKFDLILHPHAMLKFSFYFFNLVAYLQYILNLDKSFQDFIFKSC